nr:hypothetical protein [Tanacetum cinerariifolium]
MFSLVWIMPPRVMIQSVGRLVVESREGGMGVRVSRGGRGRRPREDNDERVDDLNGQENNQGLGANRGVKGVNRNVEGVNEGVRGAPDFSTIIAQQLQNLLPAMLAQVANQRNVGNQNGVLTRWIEKIENAQEMSGCSVDQKVKYTAGSFVGKDLTAGHAAYNDRFHELARLVPHLVTLESRKIERYVYGLAPKICMMVAATEPKTIQKAVQISGALTDEVVRNELIKKVEKIENVVEPSKDKNSRDDNKMTRTGNDFASTTNPGHGNQENQARGRTFMLGAKEAREDPNIVTGIEPRELGFRYEIEIASGQLVEIDKVIKSCKLEIEGHVFDIDLIPFGHGSLDVIIGMDWFPNHKAKIICHEKVVRIPLPDDKVLRVLGERPEEKARLLMSTKASDKKQEEIVVVRYFPEVFPDDLSGLPLVQEIKFRIELIPRAVPIVKSLYRLAPSELDELELNKLTVKNRYPLPRINDLFDQLIHVDPSKIEAIKNWKSPRTPTEKCKTFDWGEEQELAFRTLKDKLCNALVLALLDGPEEFVVYYNASGTGQGCVLMQRERVEYARIELFSDYDYEIRYHPGKVNVVAGSLSRKERVKPKRVRAMNMTLQSSIKDMILAAQKEAVDESVRLKKGLYEMIEHRSDGTLYYLDRIWVPLKGDVRTLIMDEVHKSKYSVHPGADKMYYDLRDRCWWPGMKRDIA